MIQKPADVFDRDHEWSQLSAFIDDERSGATLGVVSGRRRQGKSFLIEAACQQAKGFYFSAQEATSAESLALIGRALTRYLDTPAPITPPDWQTVIDILLRVGRDGPVPVVIDEFPYLARASPGLPSMIQAAYAPRRRERSESRTRLLLCGSAMAFMGGLLSGNAPLRGRASLDLTLHTLDCRQAATFWGLENDPRLAFLVHAVVGGTPAYRTEMIRYDVPHNLADFDAWVARAILSPGSPMFLEARYLLAEEPDLRDPALYHSVLAAITAGNTSRGAIGGQVGRKSNELAHPLTVLENAGLIARESDAFRANRTYFRISEPLLTFYHAIMRPFWPQLMRGARNDQLWAHNQHRFASQILGPHFEWLCREWALYFAGMQFGGWPNRVAAGTVNDPAGRTHQIDVAILGHAEGEQVPLLAIGAAKWNELMGLGHLDRLRRVRELLAANNKLDTSRTRLVCFSGVGFTEDLRQRAGAGDVSLVGLEDLYG